MICWLLNKLYLREFVQVEMITETPGVTGEAWADDVE
jgi:hypothetical protein